MLDVSTSEVNCARLSCNGARVQRNVKVHLHGLLFEGSRLKTVKLHAFLVPLERMKALWVLWTETALDVVVDAKISFDHVCEVTDNLIGVFVEQSLQLGHLLIVIEVLLIL